LERRFWIGSISGGSSSRYIGNRSEARDALDFTPVFYTAISDIGTYSATFRLLDLGTEGGGAAQFAQSGTFNFSFQVVPEPGTALLTGLGLATLAGRRRTA
jgi:hypothetical protein